MSDSVAAVEQKVVAAKQEVAAAEQKVAAAERKYNESKEGSFARQMAEKHWSIAMKAYDGESSQCCS